MKILSHMILVACKSPVCQSICESWQLPWLVWNIKRRNMSWQFHEKYHFCHILYTPQNTVFFCWGYERFRIKRPKMGMAVTEKFFNLLHVHVRKKKKNWTTTRNNEIKCNKIFIITVEIKRCYSLPYKCLKSLTKEFNWSQVANKSSYCFLLYVASEVALLLTLQETRIALFYRVSTK